MSLRSSAVEDLISTSIPTSCTASVMYIVGYSGTTVSTPYCRPVYGRHSSSGAESPGYYLRVSDTGGGGQSIDRLVFSLQTEGLPYSTSGYDIFVNFDMQVTGSAPAFTNRDASKMFPNSICTPSLNTGTGINWSSSLAPGSVFSRTSVAGTNYYNCSLHFTCVPSASATSEPMLSPYWLVSMPFAYASHKVPSTSTVAWIDELNVIIAPRSATVQTGLESLENKLDEIEANRIGREDAAQADAERGVSSSISSVEDTLSAPLSMVEAAEALGSSLSDAFLSSSEYSFFFPGVSGPFMPDGSSVTIIPAQEVDLSFLRLRFGVILDAVGVVFLGLCGWRTVDYLYRLVMAILGASGEEGSV